MYARLICIIALALMLVVAVAGCASIIHGSKQTITFQSNPTGATVVISDAMGVEYGSCETPCTIDLKRKREYKIKLMKPGYEPSIMVLQRKTDGWIWGNIFLGGVIGLVIDFSNGSAYKLSPEEMMVTLSKKSLGNIPSDGTGPYIVLLDMDNLSPEEKSKVIEFDPVPWPQNNMSEH